MPSSGMRTEETLEKNEWLSKILNSTQAHLFEDSEPISFPFRFGERFTPDPAITLRHLIDDVQLRDWIWLPLNVAWSSGLAHYRFHWRAKIFPAYVALGFVGGFACMLSNAYARVGGFHKHRELYGADALERKLLEENPNALDC